MTVLGTPPAAIDLAEDRGRFNEVLGKLASPSRPVRSRARWRTRWRSPTASASRCSCDPSTCWAGARWRSSTTRRRCTPGWTSTRARARSWSTSFLESAVEVDVDAVFDGTEVFVGGVMEHIEEAGVHSGDSACVLPPFTLGRAQLAQLREHTAAIAEALGTRGLINIQFAIRDDRRVRAGGQPPGLAHGAVHLQGHRRAAGQGRGARDGRRHAGPAARRGSPARARRDRCPAAALQRGQGGRAALQPLPRRRHAAGPRDALHRRGHGHRRRLRRRVREVPGRDRSDGAAHQGHGVLSASPTATSGR